MTNAVRWVLIDQTAGATTQDGSTLSPEALAHIAQAVQAQVNQEFAAEWGARATIRVGASETDIQAGEWVYGFVGTLPDAPGASAYHDIDGNGAPFALCAVTTCESLLGPNGVSVDVSHEILETAGDEGANCFANDNAGTLHALEMCDAVETGSYARTCADGTKVQVSNWLLRAWFIPGHPGPYDHMSAYHMAGAVAPPGPLQTAPGDGGNYQIEVPFGTESQVTARIVGTRRKGAEPNWSSRAAKRLRLAKTMTEWSA